MVVEVNSSKRDVYGNCYHWGTVTNTQQGVSLSFHMDTQSNTAHSVRKALESAFPSIRKHYNSGDYLRLIERDRIPIREFNRQCKGLPYEYRVNFEALVTGKGEVLKAKA